MATQARQSDRAAVETQVIATARELLHELGSPCSREAVRADSKLDRDLGLGSLERVELLVRLGRLFGGSLPDRVVAEADTLEDVVAALTEVRSATVTVSAASGAARFDPLAVHPPRQTGASDAPETAQTWQEVLRYRAQATPDLPHLTLLEEDSETPSISFEQLYERAQAVALRLAAKGIRRGDAVALMLPTSPEFFLTFAGILLAGAVPVPIYPPVRADRIAEYAERQSAILHNAEARLLVTFHQAERVAKLLRPRVPSLQHIVTAADLVSGNAPSGVSTPRLPSGAEPGDLALLQYTSGSTGNPKGVQLTHANLLANVSAIGKGLAIRSDDRRSELAAAISRYGPDWRVAHAALFWAACCRAFAHLLSGASGTLAPGDPSPPRDPDRRAELRLRARRSQNRRSAKSKGWI